MNNASTNGKTDARRLVEAAAFRMQLAELEMESTPAFEAWLATDPRNAAAWRRVQEPWGLFGEHATAPELLELRRRALGEARDAGFERWRKGYSPRHWKAAVAYGIGVLAIAVFLTWNVLRPDVYRTVAGERRAVTLADGSKVQLDALTELRVEYSRKTRDLKLVKGQAWFDVAHDVERPFSVLAAGQKVIATGTAFNVDLLGRDLFVTLIEGRVVILPENAAPKGASPAVGAEKVEVKTVRPRAENHAAAQRERGGIYLTPGQQLKVSASGNSQIAPANVQRTTAWQTGQLIFEDEPLSSVIVRINRYATRPLSLVDEKAAALKISGVFNAGDTDGFITTLTHYLPVTADYSDSEIVQIGTR